MDCLTHQCRQTAPYLPPCHPGAPCGAQTCAAYCPAAHAAATFSPKCADITASSLLLQHQPGTHQQCCLPAHLLACTCHQQLPRSSCAQLLLAACSTGHEGVLACNAVTNQSQLAQELSGVVTSRCCCRVEHAWLTAAPACGQGHAQHRLKLGDTIQWLRSCHCKCVWPRCSLYCWRPAHLMISTASSAVLACPVAISNAAKTVALRPCPCAQ